MAGKERTHSFSRPFRTIFDVGAVAGLTDGELLERFAARRGESAELAFAALLERHGPMVFRVCKKILGDGHDALDAFQATFLVLVRRVHSVRKADSIASWLHGVAYRVASSERAAGARRRKHERLASEGPGRTVGVEDREDLGSILHRELDRLPERYRAPLVLCHLEGMTHEQAAERLGWPVGTVKSRMARGRDRLKARLARRGLVEPSGCWGVAGASKATPPLNVMDATARAATKLAAGQPIAGTVPDSAVALTQGVLKTMTFQKIKLAIAGLMAAGIVAAAASVIAQQPEPITAIAPASGKAVEQGITYDTRFIEMSGLAWRSELHRRLKPLARRGPCTVWAVDDATLREVARRGKFIQAPRVTAFQDAKASVFNPTEKTIGSYAVYVNQFKETPGPFKLDGKFQYDPAPIQAQTGSNPDLPPRINEQDQAKGLKLPDVDEQEIRGGVQVHLRGHRTDEGILVHAEIESCEILRVLAIPVPAKVLIGDQMVERSLFVAVPETIQSHFEGEWVVPNETTLIVGLGIHQFPTEGTQPEIRERLVAFKPSKADFPPPTAPKPVLSPDATQDR